MTIKEKELLRPTEEEKAVGQQLIIDHIDLPMIIPDIGWSTAVGEYVINGKRYQVTLMNLSNCYRRKAGFAKGVWLLADRYIPLSKRARRLMCVASVRLS